MQVFFCLGVIIFCEFLREEFLTEIDFWSAEVIQDLILNLNLYLLTFL